MKIINPIIITDALLTSSTEAEDDYTAYNAATTYNTGDRCIRTSTHKIYESLIDTNVGNTPEDNLTGTTPPWLEVGPTNKWAMFDQVWSTQTTGTSPLTVVITPAEFSDSVALLNLSCTEAQITMTSGGNTVYDQTLTTLGGESLESWYDYFFEPIQQATDLVLFDLPPYGDGIITITLTDPSGTVSCGQCILGMKTQLGLPQYNAKAGIVDYSIKQTDTFGNSTILQRKYSKRMDIQLMVAAGLVDKVASTLATYRSTPLVWAASDNNYTALIVYGYYRDFEIDVAYPTVSYCSLSIEGLT